MEGSRAEAHLVDFLDDPVVVTPDLLLSLCTLELAVDLGEASAVPAERIKKSPVLLARPHARHLLTLPVAIRA